LQCFDNLRFFIFAADIQAEYALRSVGSRTLSEMNDIDREFIGSLELFKGLG